MSRYPTVETTYHRSQSRVREPEKEGSKPSETDHGSHYTRRNPVLEEVDIGKIKISQLVFYRRAINGNEIEKIRSAEGSVVVKVTKRKEARRGRSR